MSKLRFENPQRKIGECFVCPCCNKSIALQAKWVMRGDNRVHGDAGEGCAKGFDLATGARGQLNQAFGKLPEKFFAGNDLPRRLANLCTVEAAKNLLIEFCELLKKRSQQLCEEIRGCIKEAAKQLRALHLVAEYGF